MWAGYITHKISDDSFKRRFYVVAKDEQAAMRTSWVHFIFLLKQLTK